MTEIVDWQNTISPGEREELRQKLVQILKHSPHYNSLPNDEIYSKASIFEEKIFLKGHQTKQKYVDNIILLAFKIQEQSERLRNPQQQQINNNIYNNNNYNQYQTVQFMTQPQIIQPAHQLPHQTQQQQYMMINQQQQPINLSQASPSVQSLKTKEEMLQAIISGYDTVKDMKSQQEHDQFKIDLQYLYLKLQELGFPQAKEYVAQHIIKKLAAQQPLQQQ